jgi:hypothetical protein
MSGIDPLESTSESVDTMAFGKKLLKYSSPAGFVAVKAAENRADPEYQAAKQAKKEAKDAAKQAENETKDATRQAEQEAKAAEKAARVDLEASGVSVELIHTGNLPSLGLWSAVPARITFNADGIAIQQRSKMFANAGKFEVKCAFPWDEVEDVFVDGESHVTQRITATRVAVFGPLGILARKSKVKGKTSVIVYLRDKAKGRSGQLQFHKDREDKALVHRISKALDDYMPVDAGAAPTAEAIDIPEQIRNWLTFAIAAS